MAAAYYAVTIAALRDSADGLRPLCHSRSPHHGRSGGRSETPGFAGGGDSPSSPAQRRPYWSGMLPQPQCDRGRAGMIPRASSGAMWFEGDIGPVPVSAAAAKLAQPGWSMYVVLGRQRG